VTILNQIYEVDFKGFSYGFRPGRSPHQALDALDGGHPTEVRRSQRAQMCWERLTPVLNRWIPPPRVLHPYPDARLLRHSSFVRAVCVNALVRICAGAISDGRPYRDNRPLPLGEKSWLGRCILGIAKVAEATPTKRKRCFALKSMRSRSDRGRWWSAPHEGRGACGVWLRVRILKLPCLQFEDHSTCDTQFLARCRPGFSARRTDHRLGLGQRHILLEGVPRQRCHARRQLNCRYARNGLRGNEAASKSCSTLRAV